VWDEAPVAGATLLGQWLADASPECVARPRLPSDLAAICYTSGTTGRPKGAMQSQRAVVGAGVGTALMAARTAEDRVISAPPLFHVYGSCVMNAAMMVGSTLIVIPRFNEVVVLGAIAEHRATIMDGVPTAYYYLLAHPDFDTYDLSSLTRCWVGGQTPGEGRRVHPSHWLSGPRGLGDDGTGGRHKCQPRLRPEQAGHDWRPLSGERVSRGRRGEPRRRASVASSCIAARW
jgi:acyl-CoA synthetase (AMP-forming)/AMP-acid ligase II